LPADQIKMVFSLVVCFPLGFIFRREKSPTSRHVAAIIGGLFLQYLNYRNELLHVAITSTITYFILTACSKRRNTGALATFAFNLVYLSIYHIYSMITNYGGWQVDISIVLMMNVAKLTSLAWCYKDGAEPIERLSKDQLKRRVENLPSLFEYYSYLFFYATSLVGPAFDYREYSDFINLREDFQDIPSSFFPGLFNMICGFACMAVLIKFGHQFTQKTFHEEYYMSLPLWQKIVTMDIASFVTRLKYYTGWLIATGNCVMSGFSYNGKDAKGSNRWDRVVSVRPIEHETQDNLKDRLEAWNTSVQVWLKRYIFFRVCREDEVRTNPKRAALASNVTFMISAFWHGFYPAYYLVFFQLFLMQQVSKYIYYWKHLFTWIPSPIQFIIRWLCTAWLIDFLAIAFVTLEIDKFLPVWKELYYYPTILVSFFYILFMIVGMPKRKKTDSRPSPDKAKAN